MRKLLFILIFTLTAAIIGLIFSTIGHADWPTEEEQTILTAQNTLNSTVKIKPTFGIEGSGFFIAPNTVLTNWHVVERGDTEVKLTTAKGESCTGKVGYRDEKWDLALITTDCKGTPLPLAPQNAKVGRTVIVTGNPKSFDFFVTKGVICAYDGGWMAFDAYVQHGSSGSPVVNLGGEVVGIATALAKDNERIGLGVAVEDIKRFLERAK